MAFKPFTIGAKAWKGFSDDATNGDPEVLAPPSKNAVIDKQGVAKTRPGYTDTALDLAQSGKPARGFRFPIDDLDVTFFAVGTKVYYIVGEPTSASTKIDTGITLTNGTVSRFEEHNGVVYVTNSTDGAYGFLLTRLNGAVTAGASSIVTDVEGAAIASVFDTELSRTSGPIIVGGESLTYAKSSGTVNGAANNGSGLIRITTSANHGLSTGMTVVIAGVGGTTEANGTWTVTVITATTFDLQGSTFSNAFVSSGTWSATLTAGSLLTSPTLDHADDSVVVIVYDLTARFPKCDKIVAWKETLHFIGLSPNTGNAGSSDRLQTTLLFSQSATAATSENVLKISGGTSGTELIGKSGKLVNAVATRDYLYLFKENGIYYIRVADINISTGARPPQVLSENYGCLNADSAVDMGNGEVAFITTNNRIIRIKIASESGAPVVFPDESFDTPYSNTLPQMDQEQPEAQAFYDPMQKRLLAQVTVDGSATTLPHNNEIRSWEPYWTGFFFSSYFIRKGVLYATDRTDDTVYVIGNNYDDDGLAIECVMASPILEFEDGRVTCKFDQMELSGCLTQNAEVQVESIVNKGSPQIKTIDSTGVSFDLSPSLASSPLASEALADGAIGSDMGDFDRRFAIYPSIGSDLQIVLSTNGEGQAFCWNSYTIRAKAYSKSSLTLS